MQNNFLALHDFSAQTLEALAMRAIELSKSWRCRAMPRHLEGQRIGIITELPGWRNPAALALGAAEMGANCVPVAVSLEKGEVLSDLAGYLDNWFDCVAVRTPNLGKLRALAGMMAAPVVNLRTNDNHPIEVLADLTYVLAQRGSWEGLNVAVIAPRGNILQSWIEAAMVLPIHVTQISDPSFYAYAAIQRFSKMDNLSALDEADLIITDCWQEPANVERVGRLRVTSRVLDSCGEAAFFIPCPPVTRGQEVSQDAMNHPKCTARAAKDYLLHVQNAVLEDFLVG